MIIVFIWKRVACLSQFVWYPVVYIYLQPSCFWNAHFYGQVRFKMVANFYKFFFIKLNVPQHWRLYLHYLHVPEIVNNVLTRGTFYIYFISAQPFCHSLNFAIDCCYNPYTGIFTYIDIHIQQSHFSIYM